MVRNCVQKRKCSCLFAVHARDGPKLPCCLLSNVLQPWRLPRPPQWHLRSFCMFLRWVTRCLLSSKSFTNEFHVRSPRSYKIFKFLSQVITTSSHWRMVWTEPCSPGSQDAAWSPASSHMPVLGTAALQCYLQCLSQVVISCLNGRNSKVLQ